MAYAIHSTTGALPGERSSVHKRGLLGLALWLALSPTASAATTPALRSDDFIRGYAAAVLEREVSLEYLSLEVSDGVVHLEVGEVSGSELEQAVQLLTTIDGVTDVQVVQREGPAASAPAAPPDEGGAGPTSADRALDFLPSGELFRPLLADPRWPHFSASYQRYLGDDELRQVGSATFGESFGLLRGDAPASGRWELGLQAGVFSTFDLDAESLDLVNSDFMVGVTGSYQRGDLSALLRFYHQSSHLGDEFLLRNRVQRINLSYEVLDALISYEFASLLRLYGGGGYMVHRDPSSLAPGLLEAGAEIVSPRAFGDGVLRPLAALDLKWNQESSWDTNLSVRAGTQIESPILRSLRLQLLLEYYRGQSPNGQFFARRIEYAGVGAHLYF